MSSPPAAADWPQWRGPSGTGVAPEATPPIEWSETKNVRWKKAIPGMGHSTPVIAGGRIFLTTAVAVGEAVTPVFDNAPGSHDNQGVTHTHSFRVLAIDLATGAVVWDKEVARTFPHEGGHMTGSLASNSPVTDGDAVYAFFGSRGLYCLSCADGTLRWKKDLGKLTTHHAHGEGASPRSTARRWWFRGIRNPAHASSRSTRNPERNCGSLRATRSRRGPRPSSPWCVECRRSSSAPPPASAATTWPPAGKSGQCGGMSRNVIATPVAADGKVFCGCSYDQRAMIGINLEGATGDITTTDHVLWSTNQRTPYVPSPLLYDGRLYFLAHYQGLLSCLNAATGERAAGPVRLNDIDDVYASLVGAAGRVYITDRTGLTVVVKHGRTLDELARNQLDDRFSASAAIVGRDLVLRGEKNLYCLREAP